MVYMKEPKSVKELYESLTRYLTYKHRMHVYHDDIATMDIVGLSDKGIRNFLRTRPFYSGNGYVLSYGKASTMQDVWRMYINERSA